MKIPATTANPAKPSITHLAERPLFLDAGAILRPDGCFFLLRVLIYNIDQYLELTHEGQSSDSKNG
jgi:hypothetical protein